MIRRCVRDDNQGGLIKVVKRPEIEGSLPRCTAEFADWGLRRVRCVALNFSDRGKRQRPSNPIREDEPEPQDNPT